MSWDKVLVRWFVPFLFIASLGLTLNMHSRRTYDSYHDVIWSDAAGYYVYLPATFIYDYDANSFPAGVVEKTGEGFDLKEGKVKTKYFMGTAVLCAPFFLVAHLTDSQGDGFSKRYHRALTFAALFYTMLGLFFLQKVLTARFGIKTAALTILFIYLGTNLYYYTIDKAGMSHAYSFFLFTLVVYLTNRLHAQYRLRTFIILVLSVSLIALIRPTNALIVLWVVFGYGWTSFKTTFLGSKFLRHVAISLIALGVVWLPQFMYWNYLTGSPFHYAYSGEGFDYTLNPQVIQLWFSANNGWLVYSPIMIFALYGIRMMIRKGEQGGRTIGVILIVATYILASWWCWWYGCSYGSRSYVEYYALLAIPLACVLQRSMQATARWIPASLITVMVGLCVVNLMMIYEYDDCYYGTTWDYWQYWKPLIGD